jgi:hypothetical protein
MNTSDIIVAPVNMLVAFVPPMGAIRCLLLAALRYEMRSFVVCACMQGFELPVTSWRYRGVTMHNIGLWKHWNEKILRFFYSLI